MRILVAPNSFRDGIDAPAAAAAMQEGVRRALPDAELLCCPLADGGDGTLGVLAPLLQATIHTRTVRDPLGRPVAARFGISGDSTTALIEMAEASGVRLVAPIDRDPYRSSTYGTGQLISAALDMGVSRIILGAGGSGTIDGGAGALAALGVRFLDHAGTPLAPEPSGLTALDGVDLSGLDPRLAQVELIICSDVFTPLSGNASVYGVQKGVRPETALLLDQAIERLGRLASRRGYQIFETPWLGAGGGLAGGLAAFAGGRAVGGAEFIAGISGLPALLSKADLLLTGEGKLDGTSHQGKIPLVAASMAAQQGVPAVVLAGQIDWQSLKQLPDGVSAFSITPGPLALQEALRTTPQHLTWAAEQVARLYAAMTKGAICHVHG